MSDNFHQAVMGGTGANHIMLGTGDAIWFSRWQRQSGRAAAQSNSSPQAPPTPAWSTKSKIPNPPAGTNNWYTEDGYGGGSFGSPSYGGGTYSDCSDRSQPGVAPVINYLSSLPRPINPNCEPGHYYLLNNYNPGYFGDGTQRLRRHHQPDQTVFTIPPSPAAHHRRRAD